MNIALFGNGSRFIGKILLSTFCVSIVLGCDANAGALAKLSNHKLTDRSYRCKDMTKPAPGAGISCENIKRECAKRSKKAGYKLC